MPLGTSERTLAPDAIRGHELRAVRIDQDGRLKVLCHARAIEILAALQRSDDER